MKKRLLSVLLCLAILLTMLPVAVLATDTPVETDIPRQDAASGNSIWVGGVEMAPYTYLLPGASSTRNSLPAVYSGYAYWNGSTLTLHEYGNVDKVYTYNSYTTCIYYVGSFTIKLEGDNFLSNPDRYGECISVVFGDVTIVGPGSLTISGHYPIFMSNGNDGDGDITVKNATLKTSDTGYGEWVAQRNIYTRGTVTFTNSTVDLSADDYVISASKIVITKSNVRLNAYSGEILWADNGVSLSGCKFVTPTSGRIAKSNSHYYACNANGTPLSSAIIAVPFSDVASSSFYNDPVYWAVINGITTGTGGSNFSPNKPCTRAEAVTFIWRFNGKYTPDVPRPGFVDVPANAYYYDAVRFCVQAGITTGTGSNKFSPNAPCTRAQIVTFLWRSCGEPEPTVTSCAFRDIEVNSYYYDAMMWAVQNGITTGTGYTTFSPNKVCTRGEIVTFLYRTQQYWDSVI